MVNFENVVSYCISTVARPGLIFGRGRAVLGISQIFFRHTFSSFFWYLLSIDQTNIVNN